VAGELVGTGELLAAAGELAGMGLLARVGADVTSLVLKTVESLVAERALVGARQLVGVLRRRGAGDRAVGLQLLACCAGHGDVSVRLCRLSLGGLLLIRIQEVGEL
jgi:hypothetical protein